MGAGGDSVPLVRRTRRRLPKQRSSHDHPHPAEAGAQGAATPVTGPAKAKRTRKTAEPATPIVEPKPATGPRGELIDRKGFAFEDAELAGYIVLLPFREFETVRLNKAHQADEADTRSRWITRCVAHGTVQLAANGTEAERQGARKAGRAGARGCAKVASDSRARRAGGRQGFGLAFGASVAPTSSESGTTVRYDGALSSTDAAGHAAWLAERAPVWGYSPVGPAIPIPPETAGEASAITQAFLNDRDGGFETELVGEGDPPPAEEAWLAPGETEPPGTVH